MNKSHIFYSCCDKAYEKLLGRRNEVIVVTEQAYRNMDEEFARECELRNIEILIVDS